MINVKRIFAPVTFNPFVPVVVLLRWLNRGYGDYSLRAEMGEWTREEARAEIRASMDVQERNQVSGEFWHREVE